jgi:hypothetical protein
MLNDRPIENPQLQKALNECQRILHRYGFAGALCLVSEDECAFGYKMHADWSAFRPDASTELGFRLRAKSAEDGADTTHKRVEGAMHTVCQMHDFAEQTAMWMQDLMRLARAGGIDFDHTPFNGRPPPHLDGSPGGE